MEVYLLVVVALAICIGLWMLSKPPAATPSNVAAKIDVLERKAAELEMLLAELPDDDDDDPDSANAIGPNYADWGPAPGYFMRDIDIPLQLEYVDGQGRKTEREVTVQSYSYGPGGGVLSAYCHRRGARRTFYFTRISRVTDPATGEVIQQLGPWLDHAVLATVPGKAQELLDSHEDAIEALFYVAKSDGAFRAQEKIILSGFLRASSPDCTVEIVDLVMAHVAQWAVPSAISFGKALNALKGKPDAYRDRVIAAANNMIATDKAIAQKETTAIKRMTKELSVQS